ncbi:MAG: hypothetical protein HGA90_03375, partial [Alphaproteobacteria bacterium]|nr:hypothetical protein [Alphaproteobacteria bacterium]
ACAFLFLAFSVGDARAADEAEFFVVANSLHAEAERAEICLALNQSISLDRGALAAALRLKKDGVRIPVAARDLSVTPAEFCVQQLEHRHRYQLAMEELQDREGRELAKAVNLSFTVPNRKPSLTLVSQASAFGLPRVTKDKSSSWTQTAVNVKAARLTLYRLEDRSKFAAAWQHYAQLGLTPSESFTFASQNGQQVWQHDLTFDGKPDVEQSRDVPLPSDLPPGLYFLASMPQTATTANPSLFAGAWFLVSDLKLAVLSGADGLHVVGTDAAVKRVLPGVQLQASASDGRVLAEAKSGADGAAKLALAQDRLAEAAFVTGVTAAGDVVIVDLAGMLKAKALDPTMEALMVPDRALYQPGSTAKVLLLARDEKGRARKVANSQLRLLRPDRSLFSEQTVPSEKAGAALLDVSLPTAAEAGAWTLVWQQAEGKVLTEASVALSAEPKGAKLEMTADRAGLDQDGLVTLTVKAVDLQGKPLPWRLGQVSWQEARPVFAGWKSYDFGASPRSLPEDKPVEFMTGAEGSARVQLKLPVEATPRSPAVAFKAQMIHAAEPTLLTLPVRSGAEWVGIRAQDGVKPFPENSMAAFDVVALDNNGKRRATGELFFQVFEEGRRFEWYQADGRWNYKPLPQHRRIGGGRFAIAANAENILRWPVTAGQYVLEIRNAEGDILAQYPFDAGRGAVSGVEGGEGRFVLQPPSSSPEPKRESRFVVKLAEPAMVVLTMADGRTRQTIHRFLPAGESALGFMPTEDWGRRLQIQAEALFAGGSRPAVAQLTLPLRHSSQELGLEIPVPPIVASGTMFPLPVTVQKNAGKSPVFLSALVTPMPADGTTALAGVAQTFVQTERDGKAQLRFAVPEFSGSLRLTLAAWNEGQAAVKTLTVPAKPAVAFNVEPPRYLAVGDQVSFNVTFENVTGADGNYTYNLVLPEGLKVGGASKGTVALKRGKSHAVNLTLTGARPLEDVLWLELEGPNNFHASRPWPISVRADRPQSLKFTAQKIEPQQTLTVSPAKTRKGVETATVLVSPVPLAEAPRRLQALLDFDPFTTMELAQWLNVSWLWRAEIASFGLMGEGNLKDEQASRLKQLLQRQKGDGGFSAFPSGAESDMTSTSAALIALRDDEPQAATQAAQ